MPRNACLAVVLAAGSMLGLAGVATAAGAYDTDEEGRYALTGLAAGAYRLAYAGADRYLATTPSTVDVTLAAGEQTGADFGMKGASISGSPWLDTDFDGRRDAGEPISNPSPCPTRPT